MVDLHKTSDQRMDHRMDQFQQETRGELRDIKAHIKGINVHLDDLEVGRRALIHSWGILH